MLRFELAYFYDVWSNIPLRGRTLSPGVHLKCALGIGEFMARYQELPQHFRPSGVKSFEYKGHTYLAVGNLFGRNSILYKSGLKLFEDKLN